MCSPRMMQNMKQIFQTCLCIAALIYIWCILLYLMLTPVNNTHTAIIEKKKERNNKWIYNLGDEKRKTVSPRNNFQDLSTSNLYFDLKIAFLAMIPLLLLIIIFCYFRKVIIAGRRVNSATNRDNMVIRYQNDRVMLGLENAADDEINNV